MGLYRDLKLPPPTDPAKEPFPIFIYGGSTAMGVAAITFAKLSGATVIATASPANFDYVKSYGADHVVDYNSETIVDDVRALTDGKLQLIYDCSPSNASGALCAKMASGDDAKYASLTYDGTVGFKSLLPNAEALFPLAYSCFNEPWYLYGDRPASLEDFESSKAFVETTAKLLEQGKVKPPKIFLNCGGSGLDGVLHGIGESRAGNVRGGKLVYTMA
jgi:NADPH:quinone reductase-like Zn-dependent oxidoreductase